MIYTHPEAERESLRLLKGSQKECEAIGDLLAVLTDIEAKGVTAATPPFLKVTANVDVATVRYAAANVTSIVARQTQSTTTIMLVLVWKCRTDPQVNAAVVEALKRLKSEGWI